MSKTRALKIAVMAMGGQGGGVLANWIVQLGEENGFIAQATSVPGVAQRTGATIYYVELFPLQEAKAAGKDPVLALMPAPGDVDIVIAAELVEAGRAIKRGLVTKQTTLIASIHRDYAISEKIALGDARQVSEPILSIARESAGKFIGADMAQAATEAGCVISAVLFGALAGSGALPIARARYEDIIHRMDRAVEANLRGFVRGFDFAQGEAPSSPVRIQNAARAHSPSPAVAPLVDRMQRTFPPAAHFYILEGLKRTVDFQDVRYGEQYLDRLDSVLAIDTASGGDARDFLLTQITAKHLALWMTFEDMIRVADLKTRKIRFSRFREDVRAGEGQIVEVREFMHPRVEEFCDVLPTPVAKFILNSKVLRRGLSTLLGKGKRIPTTKLRGFLPLYGVASLRFLRRASYRNHLEQRRIDDWLAAIIASAEKSYDFAVAIASLQRLIKGYGETHERGLRNFHKIMAALASIKVTADPSGAVRRLIDAALKDEEGVALETALGELYGSREQAA